MLYHKLPDGVNHFNAKKDFNEVLTLTFQSSLK